MQQTIINGESGVATRAALNGNFTELYGALNFPLKNPGISGNIQQAIPANSFIAYIFIEPVSGAPVLQIGSQGGLDDILPSQAIAGFVAVAVQQSSSVYPNIFVTLAGGEVNLTVVIIQNIF